MCSGIIYFIFNNNDNNNSNVCKFYFYISIYYIIKISAGYNFIDTIKSNLIKSILICLLELIN